MVWVTFARLLTSTGGRFVPVAFPYSRDSRAESGGQAIAEPAKPVAVGLDSCC